MRKPIFIRSAYNYDGDDVSRETSLSCLDESLAVQSERDEVDINTIVRRFGLTGELPSDVAMPKSGDFTGLPDFHTAMNMVRAAQEEFMRVPAELRARFQNDPQQMIQFCEDPANLDELRKLGLANPAPVVPDPVVMDVRVVSGDVSPKT